MTLFASRHGIIPSCDVDQLTDLEDLVNVTCKLQFITGYKIGMNLVVRYGINQVMRTIRKETSLPIIYDHQKFGTDIPDVCGGRILEILRNAKVDGIIVFPQSGIETLRAVIEGCKDKGLVPIVGGDMTHSGYLLREGGYIADTGPESMYMDAGKLGVKYFVVPGTRPESMKKYRSELGKRVKEPKFLFPGVGKGQGGDIVLAFNMVGPFDSYAIVGRGIYGEKNRKAAAQRLWHTVSSEIPDIVS